MFESIVQTPKDVNLVGYKWVFVRKINEINEITRYKALLMAQGFLQKPRIDYEETYSPARDTTTFGYLISSAVSQNLEMRLMDVVTAYLYGDLNTEIFMKIPKGFPLPEAKPRSTFSIELRLSLYGLKQSRRIWYYHLSEYLFKWGYENNHICPCLFIKKFLKGFAIVEVYVDDINLIGTLEDLKETINYLKKEFEMKNLGKRNSVLACRSRSILVRCWSINLIILRKF